MRYKAVLFDMDGTVLDTLADLTNAVNHVLALYGMPQRTPREVAGFLGNGAERLLTLSVPAGTSRETVREMLAVYQPWYDAHCLIKTAPYDGILPLMQELKEHGLRLAIISNKPDRAVQELSAAFFPGLLELSVGESPSVRRKPAPDTVLKAAAQIGLPVDQCVYVGDSEVDLQTARNAGMDCISVTWGFRDEPQLLDAGAATLVHTTKELRDLLLL